MKTKRKESKGLNASPVDAVAYLKEPTSIKGEPKAPHAIRADPPPGNKEKLWDREYDKRIADAEKEIRKLKGRPGLENEITVSQLQSKIIEWRSAKLGVTLPAMTPTRPIDRAPSAPKPNVKSFADVPPEEIKKLADAMREAVDNTP